MKTGIDLIKQEREDQIIKHGYTIKSDFELNKNNQLITAARLLLNESVPVIPPFNWDRDIWHHMANKSFEKRVVIAGALCAAATDLQLFKDFKGWDRKIPQAIDE